MSVNLEPSQLDRIESNLRICRKGVMIYQQVTAILIVIVVGVFGYSMLSMQSSQNDKLIALQAKLDSIDRTIDNLDDSIRTDTVRSNTLRETVTRIETQAASEVKRVEALSPNDLAKTFLDSVNKYGPQK